MLSIIESILGFIQDPQSLIATVGVVGLTLIVFAETGLLFGFFLPGDSLLITAGVFAATGSINVWLTGCILSVAAILGDACGYWIGKKSGPLLYRREDSLFFKKKHLMAAQEFYQKHGGKTIILARFMPIIRTFAPTVAGIAQMSYSHFAFYNIVGGLLWVWSMLLGGYYLGSLIPNFEKNIHFVIVGVIALSFAPVGVHWLRSRKEKFT